MPDLFCMDLIISLSFVLYVCSCQCNRICFVNCTHCKCDPVENITSLFAGLCEYNATSHALCDFIMNIMLVFSAI